jgi:hypothetical protein
MKSSTKQKLIKAIDIKPKPKPTSRPPKSDKPAEKPKNFLDGKPKPKISVKSLADAGIKVDKGQLKISKPKTPEQAISQLKIVTQIHTKAMSMVEAASKLPKGDPQKQKILMAAASVDRAFKRTVSQSKKNWFHNRSLQM